MVTTRKIPAQKAIDHFLHGTGLKETSLDPLDILNTAGVHFFNARAWRFLKGGEAFLDARGNISITDGTWTEATKTLTSTGAFEDYTFIDEDYLNVTGGTGVIQKRIEIASRTDDDNIVLVESLSSAAGDLATGDIACELFLPKIELPDDYAHYKGLAGSTTIVNSVRLVDHQVVNELRGEWDRKDNSGAYHAALIYVGTPPRPVLDVHPYFSSNTYDVFRLDYLRTWVAITKANETLPIPAYCNGAFFQLCRHFARGWEDEEVEELETRLERWELGPVFKSAARQDGRTQQSWGRMGGGAVRRTPRNVWPNALSSEVAGPS